VSLERDEVYTTEEVVNFLKISRPTFYKYIHQGKIRATKVGGGWRILDSELVRFLDYQRVSDEIAGSG